MIEVGSFIYWLAISSPSIVRLMLLSTIININLIWLIIDINFYFICYSDEILVMFFNFHCQTKLHQLPTRCTAVHEII